MKKRSDKKPIQKLRLVGEDNPYFGELAEIKAEIASLNLVVTRVLEHSNRQQMNIMLTDLREDLSRPMVNYMLNDTRETIGCMSSTCEKRSACHSAFENLLQDLVLLLLDENVSEEVLTGYQQQFERLKECATTDECNTCIGYASNIFNKQIELVRSFCNLKDNRTNNTTSASISTLSEDVVNSICEPLANKQRLLIMRSLVNETKSFSELSKVTNLRGGNLLFHIQKLLDTGMILQKNERGDYFITSKGQVTLQGLADLYTKIGN